MKKHIEIDGMSCEHCVNAVKTALEQLGATDITVNLEKGFADAEIDADNNQIIEKITDEGFEIKNIA